LKYCFVLLQGVIYPGALQHLQIRRNGYFRNVFGQIQLQVYGCYALV